MEKSSRYIDSLTALRGIAALWVFVYHFDAFMDARGYPTLADPHTTLLVQRGYMFVDFFFILSGFIITHVYGKSLAERSSTSVRVYLRHRFFRIYPLHIFCLCLFAVMALALKASHPDYFATEWEAFFPVKGFFYFALFGISFGLIKINSWNLPSWSISAEWWTYVIFAFAMPLLNTGFGRKTWAVWLTAFAGLAAMMLLNHLHSLNINLSAGLARCVLEFSIGIGVYQVYRKLSPASSIFDRDWLFACVAIAIPLFLHFDLYDVLEIPLFGLLILCAALNTGVPRTILNLRPLRFLGEISYSVYLVQLFWILMVIFWLDLYWKPAHPQMLPTVLGMYGWLVLTAATVIVTATLTHHYIEVPGRRLGRSSRPLSAAPLPARQ